MPFIPLLCVIANHYCHKANREMGGLAPKERGTATSCTGLAQAQLYTEPGGLSASLLNPRAVSLFCKMGRIPIVSAPGECGTAGATPVQKLRRLCPRAPHALARSGRLHKRALDRARGVLQLHLHPGLDALVHLTFNGAGGGCGGEGVGVGGEKGGMLFSNTQGRLAGQAEREGEREA